MLDTPYKKLLAVGVGFALVVAACGGDTSDSTTTTPQTTTTVAGPDATTTEGPATTTSEAASPTTTQAVTTTTGLPGELVDYGPREGAVLAVVGVEADDVLNVREAPGIDREIVATLGPLSNTTIAQGQTRLLPNSAWYLVDVGGISGWAGARFLAQVGDTRDETAFVADNLESDSAESLEQLAENVAATFASTDPASTITIVDGPTVGDLGEVIIDVLGLGDDSLYGFRVHVFAVPGDGSEWQLKTVEVTSLCGRGVTDGLCI